MVEQFIYDMINLIVKTGLQKVKKILSHIIPIFF